MGARKEQEEKLYPGGWVAPKPPPRQLFLGCGDLDLFRGLQKDYGLIHLSCVIMIYRTLCGQCQRVRPIRSTSQTGKGPPSKVLESENREETRAWSGENHAHQVSFQPTAPGPWISLPPKTGCFTAATEGIQEMPPQNRPPWTSDSGYWRKRCTGRRFPEFNVDFR